MDERERRTRPKGLRRPWRKEAKGEPIEPDDEAIGTWCEQQLLDMDENYRLALLRELRQPKQR